MTRTRDDFVKECPAFGLDAEGKPGIDESSKSCQYCLTTDGPMHDACKAECDGAIEMGSPAVVYDNKSVTKPVTAEEPVPAAGKKSKKEKAIKVPKPPKEKKAKKEKAPKEPKAERGPTVPAVIAQIFRDAKEPLTKQQINDEITKVKGGGSGRRISWMISFAVSLNALKKTGNAYSLV